MGRYLVSRLIALLFVLFGVSIVVFSILKLVPGDPAALVAGLDARPEDVERMREKMGLTRPLPIQYWAFISSAAAGDLGESIRSHRPVVEDLAARLPASLQLATASLVLAIAIGLPLGVVAATRHNTLLDNGSMVLAVLGVSAPSFWIGLMLILVFAVNLGWFPTTGRGTWQHLVLPSLTLALGSAAIIARMTRSGMLEVLRQDYVRTARAKGLREGIVVRRHALKNAMIPSLTIVGLQFGYLLGGTVITETLFAYPGVGWLLVEAIRHRDFPVVQGTILVIAGLFALINLLVDLLYLYLDPRIKYA